MKIKMSKEEWLPAYRMFTLHYIVLCRVFTICNRKEEQNKTKTILQMSDKPVHVLEITKKIKWVS